MNGGTVVSSDCITDSLASYMTVTTGYFGDNGKKDILVRNQNTGLLYIWLMDGPTILSINLIDSSMLSSDWLIRSVADFDGDGYDDILLWNASSRQLGIWFMDGVSVRSKELVTTLSSDWSVQTVSDFNGDHKADLLLLRSSTGEVRVWIMDGSTIATWAPIMTVSSHWVVVP
jgi:hypothetical protein